MLWIARSLVLTMLIAIAAYCIETAVRGHSARTRWVWAIGLILSAFLPLMTIVPREVWPTRLHSPPILSALHSLAAEDAPIAAPLPPDNPGLVSNQITAPAASASRPYLLWVWLTASAFCLLRYTHGWIRLRRALRRWQPARLADDVVLISDGLGPAIVGLFRARVVVPQWVMTAPAERQHMILQHEKEHVRACDHVLLGVAPLLAILFPWNPGVWWQLRRFRLAVECDCDARVLRAGVARAAYGAMLLDVATTRAGLNFGLAGLIEPRSLLQRRIEAMKAAQIRKKVTRVVMLHGTALAALFTAVLLTAPPSAPAQAQSGAQSTQAPRAGDMLYVVDGKVIGTRAALDATALGVTVGKITVLSPAAARARYGTQGANGAVVITTQPANTTDEARAKLQPFKPPVVVRPTEARTDTTSASVTKRAQSDTMKVVDVRGTLTRGDSVIVVDGKLQMPAPQPLIIIDGRLTTMGTAELEQFDPNTIESIEMIKGAAALTLYGERGRNGVIYVTTKRD